MQKLLKPLLAVKTKRGYSIFTAVVVTLFSTWVIYDESKLEVAFAADGDAQTYKTHAKTVGDFLEELDIAIEEHDYLSHDKGAKITEGMEIAFKEAEEISLVVDGETEKHYTTVDTVEEFFQEIGLELSEHDEVSSDPSASIVANMDIIVKKAFQVEVVDKEEKNKYWTTGGTVQELLSANNIALNELDKIEPALKEEVTEDTVVSIIRVVKKKEEKEEEIPFKTEERKDSSLEKGKKKVIEEGKTGVRVIKYEVTYENDEETERDELSEEVKEEPKTEIVAVGTKEPKLVATGNSSAPSGSGKVLTMEATGYGADCSGCSGITATGINIKNNPNMKIISVDPNVIPLGSRVWVEGYGEAIAGDTGGAIKGNRIDVLLPSEAYAAQHWGRRTVQVKILN